MIIWGCRTRLSESADEDVLKGACPQCKSDLKLNDLKKWFTLYFIPLFPYSTIESCYKCVKCEQTYKQEIKKLLAKSGKERERALSEGRKMFAVTLSACMAHMASVDGKMSREEQAELDKLNKAFPEFRDDIKKTIDRIGKAKNNDAIFTALSEAKKVLTADGIMVIIAQLAKVLLADGKIDRKEEALMKEYLLVCGIPRDAYDTIIERAKGAKK